jgi:hypothetical protein
MDTKVCSKCGIEQDIAMFNRDKHKASGYRSWCKTCDNINSRVQYYKDPQLRRDKRKEFYYENREAEIQRRGEFRKNNIDMHRGHKYMQLYGITLEQFEEMRVIQNCSCAICGKHESQNKNKKLHVDHDHKTGKVRQLLCNGCNTGIGLLKEDTSLLQKALDYLIKHKEDNG